MVRLTLRTIYPRGPFNRGLDGPQSRSGRRGEEENLASTGTRNFDPSAVELVASCCVDCAILAPLIDKPLEMYSGHAFLYEEAPIDVSSSKTSFYPFLMILYHF
jgi:hypothetical protein